MMRKTILYILVFALVVTGLILATSGIIPRRNSPHTSLRLNGDNPHDKPAVKIGGILPITGGIARMGEGARNGALMAIDKLNSNAGNKYFYKFIFEDIGLEPSKATPIYIKLKELDNVVALVSFNTAVGKIIKPLADRDKVLHISSALDNEIPDSRYNYVNGFSLTDASNKFASYMLANGLKTVSLVTLNHASTEAVLGALLPVLKENNIEILSTERFNIEQRDFKMEALRVKKQNPDVVFVYVFEPVLSLFSRELLRVGYKGELNTFVLFAYSDNPSLFAGQHFVDIKDASEQFNKEYRDRFGVEPQASSTSTYDSIMLIAEFVEKHGIPKETGIVQGVGEIRDKLSEIVSTYEGPVGKLKMDGGLIVVETVVKRVGE